MTFQARSDRGDAVADGDLVVLHTTQLGWVPPSPLYLFRMSLALRKARREHR